MAVDTVGPLRNPPVDRWSTSHFYDLKGFFFTKTMKNRWCRISQPSGFLHTFEFRSLGRRANAKRNWGILEVPLQKHPEGPNRIESLAHGIHVMVSCCIDG
jgi:hypothetical protein